MKPTDQIAQMQKEIDKYSERVETEFGVDVMTKDNTKDFLNKLSWEKKLQGYRLALKDEKKWLEILDKGLTQMGTIIPNIKRRIADLQEAIGK